MILSQWSPRRVSKRLGNTCGVWCDVRHAVFYPFEVVCVSLYFDLLVGSYFKELRLTHIKVHFSLSTSNCCKLLLVHCSVWMLHSAPCDRIPTTKSAISSALRWSGQTSFTFLVNVSFGWSCFFGSLMHSIWNLFEAHGSVGWVWVLSKFSIWVVGFCSTMALALDATLWRLPNHSHPHRATRLWYSLAHAICRSLHTLLTTTPRREQM